MKNVNIYVDGSCEDNRNVTASTPAGWGFCVVVGDSGTGRGQGDLVAEKCGRVVTDPEEDGFLGAEVGSNNTAELSAIAHALRWILVNSDIEEVLIRTDSTYAGNVSSGAWKAKANIDLARFVQNLWKEVSRPLEGGIQWPQSSGGRSLEWEHVRAHRGHRWNERADHLAFRAMKGEAPIPLQFWKPGMR